jgi:regulator of cell morphogenesis and NO signaling
MGTPARSAGISGQELETAQKAVRNFVLERPATARVFEQLGIDYCCGGDKPLGEACKAANRSVEAVLAAIEQCDSPRPEKDWRNESLTDLAQHIVNTHHVFTQAEISRLTGLIGKVNTKHGQNHPELARVQMGFAGLAEELREHMRKEEELLFPYIAQMEDAARIKRQPPEPMFGSVQNPVAAMIMEHEAAGQALEKIREVTGNYTVPADGCATFHALYQALPAFAADLHQHIHLENNILFPRAVELESNLSGGSR